MKSAVSVEDKKAREAQTAAYKAAGWRLVIRMTPRGGGRGVMERSVR